MDLWIFCATYTHSPGILLVSQLQEQRGAGKASS
jgi:hypothetical protein